MKNNLRRTHVDIGIVMRRNFSDFDASTRNDFLNDLSFLVACPTSDFHEVKFAKGCVLFLAIIPIAPAMRLIRTFSRWKKHPQEQEKTPDIVEFDELAKKYLISDISSNEINENTTLGYLLRKKHYRLKEDKLSQMNPIDKFTKSIIFIHGWRWEGEFVKKEIDETFGRLPNFLAAEFSCNHEYFNYPTGITNKTKSFYFVAKTLSNYLLNIKLDYINSLLDEENMSDEKINALERDFRVAIVAHSAGGIVTRKCMTFDPCRDELDFVKHITLISSPASGSGWLKLLTLVPGISDQVKELNKGSAFINDLNSNWLKWKEKNPECMVRCIYGAEDEVVNSSSASILDPNAVCILGVGHSDIKEVNDIDSEVYRTIVRFLNEVSF